MLGKLLKSERGSVVVLTALLMVVICGLAGLAMDGGLLYITKAKLQNAVDAAALAGSQALYEGNSPAKNIAEEYIEKNGFNKETINVYVSETNRSLQVEGEVQVNYTFMRIMGFDQGTVKASATAISGPITSIDSGLRPLAIYDTNLVYGKEYKLKEGAHGGTTGNYGYIRLGAAGTPQVGENLKYGYDGTIKVGDKVQTQPGNISSDHIRNALEYLFSSCTHGCTYKNYQEGCSRIIIVPVFEGTPPNGAKYVTVRGFAVFILDPVVFTPPYGQCEISGYFIQYTTSGSIDSGQPDFGLRGVKLTK
ncbi:TadE/TadG family type IV pilus assembly protein [Desulfitibacter alkalitolerans]|uniref:TadE/TadG family type IV pilus assembly protein n=1 Tax=Desulfitibacter alkalitolerans TaxID=264641 RepID=UPI0004861A9C|nr:TadE/TadG family type IV pilus assembly protein [Desulfitibacter alkalitolerans]